MTTTTPASGLSLWTMVRRSVLLWVGTLFLILGLVFLTIGIRTLLEEHAYKTQGLAMQAVVLDKTLVRANRQDNPHTRYLVVYRFTSANGEVSDRTADVPVEEWERLEPGQTFPVTYLPDKANSSRVPNGDEWIAALVFSIIGGVFTLLGGGLAFFEARDLVRAVRVSHQGLITDGTVLRASPTSTSINRVPQWRVHYRYRDHFGRTQEGASHLMSPEEASAWKEGDHGSVRFDREQPEFSVWMGTTYGSQCCCWLSQRFSSVRSSAKSRLFQDGSGWWIPIRRPGSSQTTRLLVTDGSAVLGFVLMMGGILGSLMDQDASLNYAGVEDIERSVRMAARPVTCRATSYRVGGARRLDVKARSSFRSAK